MPIYVGDYLRDTIGLSHAQHGAYLLSIFKYWSKGESLTDRELREVCGRELNRVSQFYVMEGGRWHHKRIDEELEKERVKFKAIQTIALKGVEARRRSGLLPAKE